MSDEYEDQSAQDDAQVQGDDTSASESSASGDLSNQTQQQLDDLTALMTDPQNAGLTMEQFLAMVRTGERPQSQRSGPSREEILSMFGEDEANQKAISAILDYFDTNQERVRGEFESRFSRLDRFRQESAFDRAVRQSGVDPASPGFSRFQQSLKSDRRYQALSRVDVQEAARYAAEEYSRKHGDSVKEAREASLMDRGSRGGSGRSGQKVELSRSNASMADIFKHAQAGREVVWKD